MLKPYFSSDTHFEAGCDEVGRGCLAGPVVAAAVILPRSIRESFIFDSKRQHKKNMTMLATQIKELAICYAVAEVSVEEIEKLNILNASFLAMHKAIAQLKVHADLLLIDGNRFNPYPGISHHCIVKGDNEYASIAAASIIAKDYRDQLMSKLGEEFPYYHWDKNAGYGTKHHRTAIAKYGICRWHRRSFRLENKQLSLFEKS